VFEDVHIPGPLLSRHRHFDAPLERAAQMEPLTVAVVAPEKPDALSGPLEAMKRGLIRAILIGDPAWIAAAAHIADEYLSGIEIIAAASHQAAAARAVALVHEGRVKAVMKGDLHTDVLLREMLRTDGGLRIGRRLSQVFVMDAPGRDRPLFVTDAAINIAPDLMAKRDIVQNAIDLAPTLGAEKPKVGILSSIETVWPLIPSTLNAAILSKMADRGQITDGLVDGPLAMDNAFDLGAARTGGIVSTTAGQADILVAPNMEAGNMVAKELTFLTRAKAGGIVVGALVPVILASRANSEKARLASCAIAVKMANAAR
jgi:phosphate butyryltransferase